jgi:hypothetical protein
MSHITDLEAAHRQIAELQTRLNIADDAFSAMKKQHAEACQVADRLANTATRLGSELTAATLWLGLCVPPQSAEAQELLTRYRATLAAFTFPSCTHS